jgi:type VI secretion system secreted protein VgrG
VKVKFRWDRKPGKDADSSCWVRVSHPWAGNGYGHIALPRVGEEVVIEFLEGDPDRPLITGRVYNGQNKSPYPLPKHATVSGMRSRSSVGEKGDSGHFNELRFDDKKGSEYVWLQAERDFHRLVKHDAFDSVNGNAWSEVLKNAYASVGENYTLTVAKVSKLKFDGDVHAKLGADLHAALAGALNVKVTGAAALKVEQAAALSVGEGLDLKVGQALNVEAGARISLKADAGVIIDGGTQLVIKAGASFVVLGPDGVSISGPMVKINSGGSAGAAASAAEASPADPQLPGAAEKNKDPLSSGDGS